MTIDVDQGAIDMGITERRERGITRTRGIDQFFVTLLNMIFSLYYMTSCKLYIILVSF